MEIITLGLGTPGTIPGFILMGLTPSATATPLVALTLYDRSTALTLEARSTALTLETRSTALTIDDR